MIEAIRASPDFPLIGFFVICLLIVVILYAVNVVNNINTRKLLETTLNKGESTMSEFFNDIIGEIDSSPISGNAELKRNTLMTIAIGARKQATGLAEKIQTLALLKAHNQEAGNTAEIIRAVDTQIQAAQSILHENAPMYAQAALGGDTPEEPSTKLSSSVTPASDAPQETSQKEASSFNLNEARDVIRKIAPLRCTLEGYGVNLDTEFELDTPECLVQKLIDKLHTRQGMKLEKGETELLTFLEGLKS